MSTAPAAEPTPTDLVPSDPGFWRRPEVLAVRLVYWVSSLLTLALGLGAIAVIGGVVTHRWQADAVLTGSMNPTIPPRSLVLAQPYPTARLHPGQVVMFTAPTDNHEQVVHRVIKVTRDPKTGLVTMQTKGDANPTADPWDAQITSDEVLVVRHHVPWAGLSVTDPVVSGALFLALLLMVFGSGVVLAEWANDEDDDTDGGGEGDPDSGGPSGD